MLQASGRSLLLALAVTSLFAPIDAGAQTLPSGWALRTIGTGALPGRATHSSGTYTVEGAGADIWGSSDQFSYVYRQWTGDVTLVARVTSIENTDPWAKAGVMIRETLSAGSKHALALVSSSRGAALQWRASTGGTTAHASGGARTAPLWLRLERRGSAIVASRSADGAAWTRIGSATISMAATVYVGLAVTSHNPGTLATARLTNVSAAAPPPAGLPSGWSSADVGSPATPGSASYAGTTFTLRSASRDIWGTADQFRFAYRQASGDVDVIARVASLRQVDEWSKAGVMIRASLRSDAAHASMFVSASRGLAFQRRPAAGYASLHTSGSSGSAPAWVKLERRGTVVTAFRSADGTTWRMIGSQTLSLPTTFYVGLAVTSHDTSASATASVTNVTVRSVSRSTNAPPTVSLTSPAAGATYTAPASITISASAADPDGSIARVEFYRGTTRIGSDSTSPYSVAWQNVAAGSYSLTAVAIDNAGASTRSAARTVIVNNPGAPTTALFNPSPDHNTSRVTSYRVEIFTAGANPSTANPLALQNVGKPAVVGGECRADVAATLGGLPAGSYFATVRAVGPSGMSPRVASSTFRR